MKEEMILELNEQPKRLKKNLKKKKKKKKEEEEEGEKQIYQNRPKLRRMTKDTEKILLSVL